MRKLVPFVCFIAVLALLVATAPTARAQFEIVDANSVFDLGTTGATLWTVDGINQLYNQSFWYRIGDTGGQQQISNITSATYLGPDAIQLTYANNGAFQAKTTYVLSGGTAGSGASDVSETINVTNTSGHSLSLHFFQYADFDLAGTYWNDYLRFASGNTVNQWDPAGSLSETIVSGAPNHHEGSFFDTLWQHLSNDDHYTLSDLPLVGNQIGPGDAVWGFEWDRTLAAGGSFIISKDKGIQPTVPEPGSLLLLGAALAGMEIVRRRTKRA